MTGGSWDGHGWREGQCPPKEAVAEAYGGQDGQTVPRADDRTLLNVRAGKGLEEQSTPYLEDGETAQQREGTCSRSFPESETEQNPKFIAVAPTRPGHVWIGSQLPASWA